MVETIRLESGHTLTGIGGSNPSLSASLLNPNTQESGYLFRFTRIQLKLDSASVPQDICNDASSRSMIGLRQLTLTLQGEEKKRRLVLLTWSGH